MFFFSPALLYNISHLRTQHSFTHAVFSFIETIALGPTSILTDLARATWIASAAPGATSLFSAYSISAAIVLTDKALRTPASCSQGSKGSAGEALTADQLDAVCAFHNMRKAHPMMVLRPPASSKNKAILASSVLETALPIRDCARFPAGVAAAECPHPTESPEHYCFYRWCVPLDRVPVQFLLPPQKPADLPHPSYIHSWRTTEAGGAFFRLSAKEQAEELAAYDAQPVPARAAAKAGSTPRPKLTGPKKRKRGTAASVASSRPRPRDSDPADTDEASEEVEEAVASATAEGMLPVLCSVLGSEGLLLETELHTSAHAAQDEEWEGSAGWKQHSVRPEVVLQIAMQADPLWAHTGVHGEGTRMERHLSVDTFKAVATFLPTNPKSYWASYGRLVGQIMTWLESSEPGACEISDVAQGVRALGEPRSHRVAGRAKASRSNPTETQHLAPNPHGGGFRPPADVVRMLEDALAGAASPHLTASRFMSAFASQVDSHTACWLSLAEFNGGVLPGLVGEASTIDPSPDGSGLHHDHSYGPLKESTLHILCHLATGAPLAGVLPPRGDAPPPAGPSTQAGSPAESAAELTSGQSGADSDGGHLADRADGSLAPVGGARLVSLYRLRDRFATLLGAPAADRSGALAAAGLEAFRPEMATAPWRYRTSVPQLMTLGTHVGPSIYLLMEFRYAVSGRKPLRKHLLVPPLKVSPKACHRMYVPCRRGRRSPPRRSRGR